MVMQYIDGLTDRQAAAAVRRCMDWKYALNLELTDPGFDFTLLHDFRHRLLTHEAGQRYLDTFLAACKARGWIKARGTQRTDSTHVLAAIRTLHRVECVLEAMHWALNQLSDVVPAWVQQHVPLEWYRRYGLRSDQARLPKDASKRETHWVGYKVHLTETCDAGHPDLITQVMTTPATTQDSVLGPALQQDLADRDVLPDIHLLDGGYVDADLLVTAYTQHQIDVIGSPFGSYSRQRREGEGYDLQAFVIDWEAQQAHCPQGHTSVHW